jgi:hypothetical protein
MVSGRGLGRRLGRGTHFFFAVGEDVVLAIIISPSCKRESFLLPFVKKGRETWGDVHKDQINPYALNLLYRSGLKDGIWYIELMRIPANTPC